jgi:hypothetical protein
MIAKIMQDAVKSPCHGMVHVQAQSRYGSLIMACSSMSTLALQRDVLSRASALHAFTESISGLAERGDYGTLRSELRLHSGHVRDLRTLRAHFLATLPWISMPCSLRAEAAMQKDALMAASIAADCVLETARKAALRAPALPGPLLVDAYRSAVHVAQLRAELKVQETECAAVGIVETVPMVAMHREIHGPQIYTASAWRRPEAMCARGWLATIAEARAVTVCEASGTGGMAASGCTVSANLLVTTLASERWISDAPSALALAATGAMRSSQGAGSIEGSVARMPLCGCWVPWNSDMCGAEEAVQGGIANEMGVLRLFYDEQFVSALGRLLSGPRKGRARAEQLRSVPQHDPVGSKLGLSQAPPRSSGSARLGSGNRSRARVDALAAANSWLLETHKVDEFEIASARASRWCEMAVQRRVDPSTPVPNKNGEGGGRWGGGVDALLKQLCSVGGDRRACARQDAAAAGRLAQVSASFGAWAARQAQHPPQSRDLRILCALHGELALMKTEVEAALASVTRTAGRCTGKLLRFGLTSQVSCPAPHAWSLFAVLCDACLGPRLGSVR